MQKGHIITIGKSTLAKLSNIRNSFLLFNCLRKTVALDPHTASLYCNITHQSINKLLFRILISLQMAFLAPSFSSSLATHAWCLPISLFITSSEGSLQASFQICDSAIPRRSQKREALSGKVGSVVERTTDARLNTLWLTTRVTWHSCRHIHCPLLSHRP